MPKRLPEDAVLFIRRYHRAGYRVTTNRRRAGRLAQGRVRGRQWTDAQDRPRVGSPTTPGPCRSTANLSSRMGARPLTSLRPRPPRGSIAVVVPEQSTPPESIIEAGYRELDMP